MKTIEAWAEAKDIPDWLLAAAKASTQGWGVGREVSEADFDQVIEATRGLKFGAYPQGTKPEGT